MWTQAQSQRVRDLGRQSRGIKLAGDGGVSIAKRVQGASYKKRTLVQSFPQS